MKRTILTTIALTYANGDIHLGHLLEAIQADIWVRFQRLQNNTCYFIGGSDAHGTAIMLSAEKKGVSPETLIESVRQAHAHDYAQFHVDFNEYYTTHSPENKKLTEQFYQRLNNNGDIASKKIKQLYDPEKEMFLADRFVKGNCPKCDSPDQYGDNCEVCGATYEPTELKNPRSAITGAIPIEKESEHYFFSLEHYTEFLSQWIHSGTLQSSVENKLQEWFEIGLAPWNISRDKPYFGFEMPDVPNKYFYVWLDAPIGYIACFQHFCEKNNIDWKALWKGDSPAELIHFIGKDIVRFHALFWPALLKSNDFKLPTKIHTHGFVTVNGEKMSKSRGTFITAQQYLAALPAEYLRYYYAAKLSNQVEDIDFNLSDFTARINSDLVGKYVNLASRCAGFITKKFAGKLSDGLHNENLFQQFIDAHESIFTAYETLQFNRATREIMALCDVANQYVDHHKPWALAKEPDREQEVQQVCTLALNLFRLLTIYLLPILPITANKVAEFLNCELTFESLGKPLLNHTINAFSPLMQRITEQQIESLVHHEIDD